MKSHAAVCRLSFVFCFCNQLARVYKVRPLLRAHPLDMSLLSLCWQNKTLLPAKLPQCPISQLEIPATFLGGIVWNYRDCDFFHLPWQGASPGPLGEDPTRHHQPPWSRGGLILPVNWGKCLGHTMEPSEAEEPARGGEQCLSY
jgi:hypothetical protein